MSAIWFVLEIIDPEKENKIAQEVREKKYGPIKQPGDVGVFIKNFIKLESTTRKWIEHLKIKERLNMRRMIDILIKYEVISYKVYQDLLDLNEYRNLVVHGHLEEVDQEQIDKTKKLHDLLQRKLDSN